MLHGAGSAAYELLPHGRQKQTRPYQPQEASRPSFSIFPASFSISSGISGRLTATEFDLLQEAGHVMPEQLPASDEWSVEITGIASESAPQFPDYLAGAIESASMGDQR